MSLDRRTSGGGLSTCAVVVAGLEIVLALYLSWIAFLIAYWFIDDGIAFTTTDADWRRVGVAFVFEMRGSWVRGLGIERSCATIHRSGTHVVAKGRT